MKTFRVTHILTDVGTFYAHALAIEREAVERYREFEAHFRDRGEEPLAGLCGNLARLEAQHLRELARRCRHMRLPDIAVGEYAWLDSGTPEVPARETVYRIANARQLLEVALAAEYRALGFFQWVVFTTADPEVTALAREMALEEAEHVKWIQNALDYRSATLDWDRLIAAGSGPGTLTGA